MMERLRCLLILTKEKASRPSPTFPFQRKIIPDPKGSRRVCAGGNDVDIRFDGHGSWLNGHYTQPKRG